jgi:uncharacterized phage protein (TIGR01671 family)
MKREIKFRAWDINNNQMLDWTTLTQSVWNNNAAQLLYSVMVLLKPNYILQQFTGLTDKNGKEIYEGDILRQSNNLCIINSCVGGFDCQMLLELKNGGTIESSTYNFSFLSEKYCEVIGNIYENSELLKQNNND